MECSHKMNADFYKLVTWPLADTHNVHTMGKISQIRLPVGGLDLDLDSLVVTAVRSSVALPVPLP